MKLILATDEGTVLDSWESADDLGPFEAIAQGIPPGPTLDAIRKQLGEHIARRPLVDGIARHCLDDRRDALRRRRPSLRVPPSTRQRTREVRTPRTGDRVTIYEDPFTEEHVEGDATIVSTPRKIGEEAGRPIYRAKVLFDGDIAADDEYWRTWLPRNG